MFRQYSALRLRSIAMLCRRHHSVIIDEQKLQYSLAHLKLKFLFKSVPTHLVELGLLFFLHSLSCKRCQKARVMQENVHIYNGIPIKSQYICICCHKVPKITKRPSWIRHLGFLHSPKTYKSQ